MAELADLIGTPPPGLGPVDWSSVEKRLGVALPSDYRAFADAFPALEIDEYLLIYRPDSPDADVDLVARGFSTGRSRTELWRRLPDRNLLPGFPEPGGLLCWGHNTGSATCYWLTGGDPDSWTIVIAEKSEYWHYPGNFTSFLTGVLEGSIECPELAEDFPEFIGGPLAIRWFV